MATFEIRQATKKALKSRFAFEGAPGSGKTRWAMVMAHYICQQEGGRFVVIDTEARSSENYAHLFDFDVLPFDSPYSSLRYEQAIRACESAGYTVIIIDSLTHEWSGPGGCLAQTSGNVTAWKTVRPAHDSLVRSILWSPAHIICTMRAKEAVEIEKDDRGKLKVTKLGLEAIQEKNIGYEFQAVGHLENEGHTCTVTKYRCDALANRIWHTPGDELSEVYYTWLTDGTPDLEPLILAAKKQWMVEAKNIGMIRGASITAAETAVMKEHLGALIENLDGADSAELISNLGQAGIERIQEWKPPEPQQATINATAK